jgi:hypothetical protein
MKRTLLFFLLISVAVFSAAAQADPLYQFHQIEQTGKLSVLKGKVFDDSTKAVVPRAKLVVWNDKGGKLETTSDAAGKYEFKLPDGNYSLKIEQLGYKISIGEGIKILQGDKTVNMPLYPGVCSDCWSPKIVLRGKVYDRFGNGISNARVSLANRHDPPELVITNSKGEYEINTLVDAPTDYIFRVESAGSKLFEIQKFWLPPLENGKITFDVVLDGETCTDCPQD